MSALAVELVRLKVDLIVVLGRSAGLAAKNATTTIPIVMMVYPDPVVEGMVASLARPGGNVTGLTGLNPELNTKRLEILKDVVPKLTRVGLLQQSGGIGLGDLQMKDLRAAAVALKLQLEEIVTQPDPQRFRERLSNRKEEAGQCDCDHRRSPLFRRKKADRRACR